MRRLPLASRVATACVAGVFVMAACSSDQSVRTTGARAVDSERPESTEPLSTDGPPDTTTPDDTTAPETTDGGSEQPVGTLAWGPCDDEAVTDDALDCAILDVPLDPQNPSGETISIALVRLPAENPDTRVGAILFNPGGPGGSGFDFIAQAATRMSSEMGLFDFDIIGFDPRGVDRSNGIRCLSDAEVDATVYLDSTPDTPEEQAALDANEGQFEAACLEKYGESLIHYSTVNTAYDMDAIRAALGDEQLSYIGISYGTYLGSIYATLFPERVRALVLDAAFEPSGDSIEEQYTTQLIGFEEAFENWSTWCEGADECAFRTDDVAAAWDQLRIDIDAAPAAASDGRVANQAVFETATLSALYSEAQWPLLAAALDDARNGSGDQLFLLADGYVGRNDDGTYSTIEQSGTIIRCASGIDYDLPDDPQALVDQLLAVAPRFAQGVTADDFTDGCAPLMPDVTAPALSYSGEAPVLVVGGLNDPATPFRWSEEMTEAMGPNARLLTYTGEGHGQMLSSTCVTEWEGRVLVELELPAEGEICDPDPDVEKPDWWDALPVPDGLSEPIDGSGINALLGITPSLAFSESRESSLSAEETLDAYDALLDEQGWSSGGRQEPVPGVPQGLWFNADGAVFSVLVFGPDAFASSELDGLDEVADPTKTLVVLLAFPL